MRLNIRMKILGGFIAVLLMTSLASGLALYEMGAMASSTQALY